MKGSIAGKPCCPRRGRPRVNRLIQGEGPLRCFAPQCKSTGEMDPVSLLPAEIEILRQKVASWIACDLEQFFGSGR